MQNATVCRLLPVVSALLLVGLGSGLVAGQRGQPGGAAGQRRAAGGPLHGVLADYDAELRGPDGRVDTQRLCARLSELGANAYFWLIWHAATDWDDLKLFLPQAAGAGIDVWVYLVPPSESPPRYGSRYPEPFRLDYLRWARQIAALSRQHPNLRAWVIDDFYANRRFFTPEYVAQMQREAKGINPQLAFLPLMYYGEIRRRFVDDYRRVIDGVVAAYPQDADEIRHAWALLNDVSDLVPGQLTFPGDTPSRPGDFVKVAQRCTVQPGQTCWVQFSQRDDYRGPTAGYHFKQLLVDGAVVWEQDVAGGQPGWQTVRVNVTEQVQGKRTVELAFRLLDRKGVSNYGVRWQLRRLAVQGLRLAADLERPEAWSVARRGEFEAGFGARLKQRSGGRRFHIPLIVMTAGSAGEFRLRHGDPASPKRMADWVAMCLKAWRAGYCDGVVTYCLDKRPKSEVFRLVRRLFRSGPSRCQPEVRRQPAASPRGRGG